MGPKRFLTTSFHDSVARMRVVITPMLPPSRLVNSASVILLRSAMLVIIFCTSSSSIVTF